MTEKIIIESFLEHLDNYSCLDKNNILWKKVGGEIIGKRSVYTKDLKSCWLENCEKENIKSYWCGVDSDYNEVFKFNS